jgi:predicted nucleotidyltransferase
MHTLNQLLHRLIDAKIDFVIIGGYAGVQHGSSYVTRDLDICAVLTPENIQRLRETLKDLHPLHRMTSRKLSFLEIPQEGAPPLQNLYLNTDWGIIDILTNVLGVGDFDRLKSTATAMPFQGKTCLVMSLEDLIKAKETLAREKDLLVAKELRAIASAQKQPPPA